MSAGKLILFLFQLFVKLNFDIIVLDQLFQRLKVKDEDFTRGMIKEKLKPNDSEIATTMLRVSLVCPLGKVRMTNPCR